MKHTYLTPELEVLELSMEDGLLLPMSAGTGTGSNMLDPDTSQDPFSILF